MKIRLIITKIVLFLCAIQVCAEGVRTTDSTFIVGSRPIIFQINNTNISQEDEDWILNYLIPELNNLGKQGIIIGRAAASPEGPTANNQRLAEQRRQAVDEILSRYGINTSIIHYDVVAEDYDMLLAMMKLQKDDYYIFTEALVKKYRNTPEKLKTELRNFERGKLWNHISQKYFPGFRAVRIMPIDKKYVFINPLDKEIDSRALKDLICKDYTVDMTPPYLDIDVKVVPMTFQKEEPADTSRVPLLNVNTNMLANLFYMPNYGFAPMWNIGLEYYPLRGHFTIGASFMNPYWHNWKKHKFFQIRNYQLETRYYFRRATRADYKGWYTGLAVNANKFGIGFNKDKGWQGEGMGGQILLGYVVPISRNEAWKLHFHTAAGFYFTHYDPYVYGTPEAHGRHEDGKYYFDTDKFTSNFEKRKHRFTWLGPTMFGITISYDLIRRKTKHE